VWATVKRGQELALETAKIGASVGAIDDAVRAYYEREGWGPGYRLPGLSHRTGHGIGMEVHEPAYLVHGDATPLAPGMCFSDEPGPLHSGRVRRAARGLLAHDRGRAGAVHRAREVDRATDLTPQSRGAGTAGVRVGCRSRSFARKFASVSNGIRTTVRFASHAGT
jgi:Xaa-Pro aminopeptidase